MFVVNQLFASVDGGESGSGSFAMLPDPPGHTIRYTNVKNGVIAIRNDIDPEVVTTGWHSDLTVRDVSTSLDMTKSSRSRD
jgi:hypothetical protein